MQQNKKNPGKTDTEYYTYSRILISGSLEKWIRRLSGSKVFEPKPFFRFLTHTAKWIRRLNGSKFKFPM